jgi:hypothetical protein
MRSQSTRIVNSVLDSGDDDERAYALGLLSLDARVSALPRLKRLIKNKDTRISTFAAATVVQLDCEEQCGPEAVDSALRNGFAHESPGVILTAARALATMRFKKIPALDAAIIERIKAAAPADQIPWFVGLSRMGEAAIDALQVLDDVASDEGADPVHRGVAALAIGAVTRGSPVGHERLLKLLDTEDPVLINFAVRSLAITDTLSVDVVTRLVPHLSTPHDFLRRSVVETIAKSGSSSIIAVPALISCAENVATLDDLDVTARAIAASGNAAVAPVIEAVRSGDTRKLPTLALAIKEIGESAVLGLVDALRVETSEALRIMFVLVLRDLGPRAAPAIPLLPDLLDSAQDEHLVQAVLMTAAAVGPEVLPIIPAIIDASSWCSEDGALWVERALWNAGPEAIPLIEKALQAATPESESRLIRVLAGLRAVDSHVRSHGCISEINDDRAVIRFVRVARNLRDARAPKSYASIGNDLMMSATSVRNCFDEFASICGEMVTTHQPKRKGKLTRAGDDFLRAAESYLRRKGIPITA